MAKKAEPKKASRGPSHSRAGQGVPAATPWSVPLDIDSIAETGLHRDIAADPATCAAVADFAAVRTVSALTAVFDLTRDDSDLVHVTGRVRARIGQNCVVTLEPIETDVDEPIDVLFAPAPAEEGDVASLERCRKADLEAEPPEPLIDGKVDLGVLATEFLILGIEPYPRKADAEFSPPAPENDAPHPFAALERLKKPLDSDKT